MLRLIWYVSTLVFFVVKLELYYVYNLLFMPKIFLCVDPGGSQTKIIYQLPQDEKPRYLLMSPEVEEIKEDNLKRYLEKESSMSNPSPIRQAYLEVNQQTFVVGYFASKFDPEDRLQEIKYENALYKTLAAVGVIVELNNLNPKKILLQLAVLLPWNEYEDREKFYNKLIEYLSSFVFSSFYVFSPTK